MDLSSWRVPVRLFQQADIFCAYYTGTHYLLNGASIYNLPTTCKYASIGTKTLASELRIMARALLTDTERERLSGDSDAEKQRVFESKSRVKKRITEELPKDVKILSENHPELFDSLQEMVCESHE
jgi:hypothetical protein